MTERRQLCESISAGMQYSFGYAISSVRVKRANSYSSSMSKVLTGVQDDRIFFKPVRKPDPPKYDSSQPEKMEVNMMLKFNIKYQ